MPYIDKNAQEDIAITLWRRRPKTVGELNFLITMQVLDYLAQAGTSYATINSLIGVLECAKLELYRRVVAPYEDEKIKENGDVYP